jgi:hypothetical protein
MRTVPASASAAKCGVAEQVAETRLTLSGSAGKPLGARAMRTSQGPGRTSARLAAQAFGAGCAPTRPHGFASSAHHGLRADDSDGRGAGGSDQAGARNRATHAFPARVYGGRLRQRGLLRFVGFNHRVRVPNRLRSSPALKKTAKTQIQLRSLG